MKIVKNKFRNKMEDGYPVNAQITFIKKNTQTFDIDLITNEFDDMKECIYSSKLEQFYQNPESIESAGVKPMLKVFLIIYLLNIILIFF